MNLIIDIGNSRTKAALLRDGKIADKRVFDNYDAVRVDSIACMCSGVERVIVSSTREREKDAGLLAELRKHSPYVVDLDNYTPVPLKNNYATPHTLGLDRLAAAVGGWTLFPNKNLLVFDFGTAITADLVTADGTFMGGSISPGAWLRAMSLSSYTGRLPLVDTERCIDYVQTDVPATTEEAIMSGVTEGIVYEIEGRMEDYSLKYDGLITIFTGGEACFFEKRLKNTIFANCDLVLMGLNTILDYNAQRKENN